MCAVAVLCRHGLPTEVERWDRGGLAGALVDLHTSIVGATADPATVWSVLSAGAETLELAGSRVLGTGSEANALIVAVHAAAHGSDGFERPCEDLTRALARCELETWQAAHRRALAIGAEPAFAAGLRMVPSGEHVADALSLPRSAPASVVLRLADAPTGAAFPREFAWSWLADTGASGGPVDRART